MNMGPLPTEEQTQPIVDEVTTKSLDRGLLDAVTEETLRLKAQTMMVEEQHFELSQRRAKMFSESGLFEDSKIIPGSRQGVARAMVKIELGESMGFSAAEALQGIYIINGQTSIASALRAGRMQSAGFDWSLQWHGTHTEPKGCTIWLTRNGKPLRFEQPQVWTHAEPPMFPLRDENSKPILQNGKYLVDRINESFLESDAKAMLTTLWEGPKGNKQPRRASILEKDNWRMSPRNMYFARAITNTQRFYAPAVLSISLMSAEEAMDLDTVVEETERRQQADITGSLEAQGKVLINKLLNIGKLDDARQAAKRFGIDFAPYEAQYKASGASVSSEPGAGSTGEAAGTNPASPSQQEHHAASQGNGATKEGDKPAAAGKSEASSVAEHAESHLKDLRMYMLKLDGTDRFAALLVKHKFASIQEASCAEGDRFMGLIVDLDEALLEVVRNRKPEEKKGAARQKGFEL